MHPTTKEEPTSESRCRLVIDNLKEVVFQTDPEGRWTSLNPAWTELTGFPLEESLGRSIVDFIHPEDHPGNRQRFEELLSGRKDFCRHEVRYCTRDGRYCWVEVFARLMRTEDGTLLGTCGTLNDVTERRRASDALARRERYLTGLVEMQQRLLAAQHPEDFFKNVLAPLGQATGASRVYLFEAHRGPEGDMRVSQRAEWCVPGVKPEIDNPLLQNLPLERRLPRTYETFLRGEAHSGLVKDLPPEERELFELQGIRSTLSLPLWVHGALAGFVGFDDCFEERTWDRLEVDLLSAASGAISLALEHRQTELELREREQRFRRIAGNASDVLYRYQVAGSRSFAYVSGVVSNKLGYGPEEHYRDPELWQRLVHPEDREALELLLSGRHPSLEAPVVLRFTSRSGQALWLQHVVSPVLDASGTVVAVEGLARDITERRQVEEALKLSEASFRILLEGVPDPVAIQRDLRIIFANAALVSTLGYESAKELLGRRLEDFVMLDEPSLEEGWRPLLPSGERRLRRCDGKTRVVEFASLPLLFDGEPAVVSIARDVTEQRQLHARLSLADRLASMGTLAAGIAHEINNPLAFVISNLSYLADELRRAVAARPDAPELAEWRAVLAEAREGADRVRQIVRQLKTFSRPDEERMGAVDLRTVLDSAVTMAANEIRHRARLSRHYGPVPPVRANEGRLCQVFLNLVVNAAQAIPEGAADRHEIRLVTRMHSSTQVAVEVQDTGSGIPRELLGRIFDPFYTTKPVGVGTGLGLSICHSIVSTMGGDISVESEPGQGTTVRVLLPVAEARLVPQAIEPPPPEPVLRRGRVLVVDDEPAVGRALRRILREHDVELATSGRQALERLTGDTGFHAILCDVMMPDLAGKELYEAVQRTGAGLEQRFVFVSGGAFTPGARDFLARVPNLTLEKPFDEATVRRVVQELVLGTEGPRVSSGPVSG